MRCWLELSHPKMELLIIPILLLLFLVFSLLPHFGMWFIQDKSSSHGRASPGTCGALEFQWVCLNNPSCFNIQPKPGWGSVILKQSSKTLMRQQQFFLGEKDSGISVFLMDCNYLMLSPECSLTELGFSRQSIMAVIAKGSLAGAGAARCNGTLL